MIREITQNLRRSHRRKDIYDTTVSQLGNSMKVSRATFHMSFEDMSKIEAEYLDLNTLTCIIVGNLSIARYSCKSVLMKKTIYVLGGYYKNEKASETKILRDVFVKGDAWYRTGDLVYRDREGLWYFSDRIGDTYRWKSENVSTAEVSEVLGRFPGIQEAIVYGVEVPGTSISSLPVKTCLTSFRARRQSRMRRCLHRSLYPARIISPVFQRALRACTEKHA